MQPDNKQALIEYVRECEQRSGKPTALKEAVRWGLINEVNRLLDSGCDINSHVPPNDVTPLMLATSVSMAKHLVKRGADINATDSSGRTPLIWYLLGFQRVRSAKSYVQTMIDLGADVSITSSTGENAYNLALEKYGEEVAALMIIA